MLLLSSLTTLIAGGSGRIGSFSATCVYNAGSVEVLTRVGVCHRRGCLNDRRRCHNASRRRAATAVDCGGIRSSMRVVVAVHYACSVEVVAGVRQIGRAGVNRSCRSQRHDCGALSVYKGMEDREK